MGSTEILKVRVTPELKSKARALADREFLTESAWLKRLVVREVTRPEASGIGTHDPRRAACTHHHAAELRDARGCAKPIYVRLRDEDRLLLDARASARGLRPATYLSVLTRSHLRGMPPLPKDELLALKRSIAELAALGRNINQLTRAAHANGRLPNSVRQEFQAMLRICEALRDNTKTLLKANAASWEAGHAQAISQG